VNEILIDENLPETLQHIFGPSAVHVSSLGQRMSDHQLWTRGRANNSIIVTKDADFFERLAIEGPPPKIIWVRTGNLRRIDLEGMLARVWHEVSVLLNNADLIEVHSDRLEALSFDVG